MTNHIHLTEVDEEVVELEYLLEVRNGKKKVKEIAESEGIKEAAKHVCFYCDSYVPKEEQRNHSHLFNDRGFQPKDPKAPI